MGRASVAGTRQVLCIPVAPESSRRAALKAMKMTYELADKVVLDRDILQTDSDLSTSELILRLECSNWHHRLWTLQEALAARYLFIQFSDRAVQVLYVCGRLLIQEGPSELARNSTFLEPYTSSYATRSDYMECKRILGPGLLSNQKYPMSAFNQKVEDIA
jgi:hypothetical protein